MSAMPSILEMRILNILSHCGFSEPIKEHKFHPLRKWRFDFAYPDHKVAIEAEGGVWINGRHNRGNGFINDTEKYNAAVLLGWKVLRYTTKTVNMIPDDLRILLGDQCKKT